MVDNGHPIKLVLSHFDEHLEETGIADEKWLFLTNGNEALESTLPSEAKYKEFSLSKYFSKWINIKVQFPVKEFGKVKGI